MATFDKKTWVDRQSTYPSRRKLTHVSGTAGATEVVNVERAEGTVEVQGDAFNATNMNNLEDRIETVVNQMNSNFQAGVNAVYNACVAQGVAPTARTPEAIASAIAQVRQVGHADKANSQLTVRYSVAAGNITIAIYEGNSSGTPLLTFYDAASSTPKDKAGAIYRSYNGLSKRT